MDKTTVGVIVGSVVILVVLVVISSRPSPSTQSELGQTIELQPATHIKPGENHPAYNSNPPTSGWHYAETTSWGIHTDTPVDEIALHNLEHGGIWISYNPNKVDSTIVKQLSDLVGRYPSKVLLSPRPADDAPIALASWGRLQKLETYDDNQIKAFIEANKNKGPEQVPD